MLNNLKNNFNINKFLKDIFIKSKENDLNKTAASLSYVSLVSLIPLFTIFIAMLSAFPAFRLKMEEVKSFLFANILPDAANAAQGYILQFSSAAANLTVFGVVFLCVTVLLLFSNIEQSFNKIFNVKDYRTLLQKFMVYWTFLTLAPLLIATASLITNYIKITKRFLNVDYSFFNQFGAYFLSFLFIWAFFAFCYAAIPNKKIAIKNALFGGVFTAIIFLIVKKIFSFFIVNLANYELIYGAFAIFPIFLAWIYCSWLIMIFGGVVTATLEDYPQKNKK